jgi:hypothetical protein
MKPKRKRGRPPTDGAPRVRLYGNGPHVRKSTKDFLEMMGPLYGIPIGRVLDALVDLAVERGAMFRLPLRGSYQYLMGRQAPKEVIHEPTSP